MFLLGKHFIKNKFSSLRTQLLQNILNSEQNKSISLTL